MTSIIKTTPKIETSNIVGSLLYYLNIFFDDSSLRTLTVTVQLTSNWKSYQLSKPEIDVLERNVRGIAHAHICV